MTTPEPDTFTFEGDGSIPNSRFPVLVYRDLEVARDPAGAEAAFAANDWRGSWRDGVYPFHHFHSTAHEVLAIVAGVGAYPGGMSWDLRRGDPAEYEEVRANVEAVPLPHTDPVGGSAGTLPRLWLA